MAGNKTKPTKVSAAAFLKQKASGPQLADSRELVTYLASYLGDGSLKKELGKHRGGTGCLYIKSLADIDRGVLAKLAVKSVAELRSRYRAATS